MDIQINSKPDGTTSVLVDGQDISRSLYALTITIEPEGRKTVTFDVGRDSAISMAISGGEPPVDSKQIGESWPQYFERVRAEQQEQAR